MIHPDDYSDGRYDGLRHKYKIAAIALLIGFMIGWLLP